MLNCLVRAGGDFYFTKYMKSFESFSASVLGVSIRRAVSNSVHREGVNPNSMEGVHDLFDHVGVRLLLLC